MPDTFWSPLDASGAFSPWITKTPMPSARGGCAYGTIGNKLFCAGGEEPCNDGGACALIAALAYAPYLDGPNSTANPWCQLANLPDFRGGTQGGVVGSQLFVPGGAELIALQPQDTLFVYKSVDDPALEPIPDTATDTKLCNF